ncbi:hypothetical protein SAMN04489760_13630 [Syntrophus gentianae]|uniref:Uncharacterized protein n=1 Tax=Syntrophus gentianae TaxID=43775 RepID=A0A1H8AIG4_9BACT|nr:hypothetical protein [Syntrophus gentianae]SEM70565.1 hypothetical protein SAMN04489760_13630 [Syntrophus gentianae]
MIKTALILLLGILFCCPSWIFAEGSRIDFDLNCPEYAIAGGPLNVTIKNVRNYGTDVALNRYTALIAGNFGNVLSNGLIYGPYAKTTAAKTVPACMLDTYGLCISPGTINNFKIPVLSAIPDNLKGKMAMVYVNFINNSGQSITGGNCLVNVGWASQYAPTESPHKTAYFRYAVPPPGFAKLHDCKVVGWMQTIDIEGKGEQCKVEIDWMRLHAVVAGTDIIFGEEKFSEYLTSMSYYGLYKRSPWFDGDKQASMPSNVENGCLVMYPSKYPQYVFHWWTDRYLIPANASRIWFEARVRITGGAGVQAGIDYWKGDLGWAGLDVNNTEAGVSDWFGASTSGWQIISVGKP